jgi:uncharacterized protein YjbI with pentapeptide repeats
MLNTRTFFLGSCLIFALAVGTLSAEENYEGKSFTEETFEGKNLKGANFMDATLKSCSFRGVTLDGANFEGADVRLSSFHRASAKGANFKAALVGLGTTFNSCDLEGADFTGVNFGSMTLEEINFKGANLQKTTGYGSGWRLNFAGADLRDADLSGLTHSAPMANRDWKFKGARYNAKTIFPKGVDPAASGCVLVEE